MLILYYTTHDINHTVRYTEY